jgi:hypothetical protein
MSEQRQNGKSPQSGSSLLPKLLPGAMFGKTDHGLQI